MSYLHDLHIDFKKATFGMGCFWGCDSVYGATKGVLRTRVGYSGGHKEKPTYRDLGDHTEVIEIDFDPNIITYENLLDKFWASHEYSPTGKIKVQYMSLILYHDESQKEAAIASMKSESEKRKKEVTTQLKPAADFKFTPAEDYHQKYRLQAHPELVKSIGLKVGPMLQTSHIAARLNGYLAGLGDVEQLDSEAKELGLDEKEAAYVRKFLKENADNGPFC